jgi:hypothetical protein
LPINRSPNRVYRRILPSALYSAFGVGILGALTHRPFLWILVFAGVCILAAGIVTAGALLSSRRRQREHAPARLFGSIASFLVGRTDVRFLPYLLAGLAEDATIFERVRHATELMPTSFVFPPTGRGPSPAVSHSSQEIVQQRRRYRKLLKAMLPQIGTNAPVELSSEQRRALLIPLQMPEEDVELTLFLLTHLEQWGDAQAAPTLNRLIRERHWYVGSDQVEAAARQCLSRIEGRLRLQNQGRALLRPAPDAVRIPSDALLRPATDRAEHSPEQLLRPGTSLPPENPS